MLKSAPFHLFFLEIICSHTSILFSFHLYIYFAFIYLYFTQDGHRHISSFFPSAWSLLHKALIFLYLPAYYTEAEEGLPRGTQLCNILRKMNMVMLEWESLLCTALGLELRKD